MLKAGFRLNWLWSLLAALVGFGSLAVFLAIGPVSGWLRVWSALSLTGAVLGLVACGLFLQRALRD